MRHVMGALLSSLLIVTPLSGQECKLLFTNSQPTPRVELRALPRAEAAKVAKARLCLKSFPWSQAQLKAIEERREFPAAAEMKALRTQMRATAKLAKEHKVAERFRDRGSLEVELAFMAAPEPWYERLSPQMQDYVRELAKGVKSADADNYATFFYYRALAEEGKFAAIASDDVAKRVKLGDVPKIKELTDIDERTYFSGDVLRAFIYIQTIEARAQSTAKTAGDFLELLLAHDAAPHEALETLGHQFAGRWEIQERLVKALEAGERPESPMLLGSHATSDGADYYAQVSAKHAPRLIRYRRAAQNLEILEGKEALAVLEETIASDLNRANPDALTLANVMRTKKGYDIQLRNSTIELSDADYKTLSAGKALADTHPISQLLAQDKPFVIYSNPLMRAPKFMADAETLGFALQAAYPRATVMRDDYTPMTDQRAAQIYGLDAARPEDFVAVVDSGSFKVKDFNVLADIKKKLKDSGWNVVSYKPGMPWTFGSGKNVIVITGHIDAKLAAFIRELGTAGYFRGNYVVLNTCYTTATTGLIEQINQTYGAHGCLRYEGKIAPDRVGELLTGIAKDSARPEQKDSLPDLLNKHTRTLDLRAIWIICRWGNYDEARA